MAGSRSATLVAVSLQSLPAVIMASVVVFIGGHNLSVFLRRPRNREHLSFFLACLMIALYDVACALLYSSRSPAHGERWQRMQLVSAALICAVAPWFIFDYFADALPVPRGLRVVATALTVTLTALAAATVLNPLGLFWSGSTPRVRTLHLPLRLTLIYNEVEQGMSANIQYLLMLAVLLFLFSFTLAAYIRTRRTEARRTLIVTGLVFLCSVADLAVFNGLLPIPYTVEYAFMGWAMLIAGSLSNKIVDSARFQEALAANEARYRGSFRDAAVALFEADVGELRAMVAGLTSQGITDLHAYLDGHPDFVRDAMGSIRIVDVNVAMMELLEARSRDELLGAMGDGLHPEAMPQFHDTILDIAEGRGRFDYEMIVHTRRGKRLDVIISAAIPDAGTGSDRILVSITDLTARKTAEEKLRAFIEQSTEAIYLVDEAGRIREINPSAELLWGVSRADAIGIPVWDLFARCAPSELRTPELAPCMEGLFREAMSTGSTERINRSSTGVLERPDGSRRSYTQFLFPIRTKSGFMLGSISHDTTEERKTMEALRLSEERLRHAQKMEAIGTLAGGIAHDFNNLLTGILGYSTLLREELPAGSPLSADVGAIESTAKRAAELTQQILTFSRKDSVVEMGAVDPSAVVREVVRLLERTADKSITIETDLSPVPLRCRGNGGQIHQAVLNLCLNACDAMPQGGRLCVTTEPAGNRVAISVTDTGIGMSEEVRRKLFEPFFTTKEMGRGLGLAMVYGIVRGHDGDIAVTSTEGKGATFRILLPVNGEQPAPAAPAIDRARGGSETILVIDDEPQVRDVAARILRRAGYTVLEAEDGARGLAVYQERGGSVDLVLLDMSMPGMGGAEVQMRLKAMDPAARVVLSSGYSDDERVWEALAGGGLGFLRKPYTLDSVLRVVRQALDG